MGLLFKSNRKQKMTLADYDQYKNVNDLLKELNLFSGSNVSLVLHFRV